jgi:hypothetical protein
MTATFLKAVKKATAVDQINSAFIFGEYGVGKTILAASATEIEDYAPVLIVDIEGSAAGVGRMYPDVDVVSVTSHEMLEDLRVQLLTQEHPYKTVIFDTYNVAQNRAEKFFKAKPENQNNRYGAWGDLKDWSISFVREMHHAPFMAIFIAHSQVDKDEATGRMITTVKISGSAKTDVPAIPDIIGYLEFVKDEEDNTVRVLRVGRSSGIITKNRFGLPDVIGPSEGAEGPTIMDIQREILKAKEGK